MDSHSRSASPREPARPQHRPPSPPSSPQSGFDNRAYQHDESDPNHNDSFTSNGPHQNHQNGHSKEPNGDTKTLEAVNLELINLTPKNGSKKKDVEVDMNATNPYDEYFVPVNEHRKYMRGEKLYVTADKRGEKGGCKRPLCWTLLGLVVIAIVALIVLAATGILFTNSPTPLEQYNASVSSARAFGGISSDHNHDHDHSNHHHDHSGHDHHHGEEQSTSPPQYGTETQSDEAQLPMTSEESSDTSMYVPKTLEGVLKIDNEIFTPELEDTESEKYRDFTKSFSDALKHALFNRNTLENGDNEIMVEVIQIRNGSLIVTYRIHWIHKYKSEPTEELLTESALKANLNNYLDDNNRMISVYHVAEEELPTTQVLDLCKINNYDCEYKCEFDDSTLDFMCVCPVGQIVDISAPKRCTPLLDNSEKYNAETATPKQTNVDRSNSNESSMKSNSEEQGNTETVRIANEESVFDWKEPRQYTPETTTETEPDLNFSHIFGPETPKPEPEPNAEPETIPISEPTLSPKLEDESDSITEPKSEPEPTSEPQAEPAPEPQAEPAPEPTAEPIPEPEAAPEPTAEPKPEPEPVPEPTAEPISESEPAPEPTAEPKFETEPAPEPEATPEPNPEPEPASSSTAEPKSDPESIAEPQLDAKTTTESQKETQSADLTTTIPETISSVKDMPVASDDQEIRPIKLNEPNTIRPTTMFDNPIFDLESIVKLQTTAEPESNENNESYLQIKPLENNENYDEGMEKMMTTTMRISLSEPNIINEPSYEPKPDIISILKENGQRMNFTSIDTTDYTTIENDWLEAEDENSTFSFETTSSNINAQMDLEMHNEGSSEHANKTEQRSSKQFENFDFDTTTDSMNENNNEDITFDQIKKIYEMAPVLTTIGPIVEKTQDLSNDDTSKINNIETTTLTNIFTNKIFDQGEDKVKETAVENNTAAVTLNQTEIKSIQNETTPQDQKLMEVIDINKTSNNMPNVTPTEKDLPEVSTDVSFDTISMLYNRSPKLIEKDVNINKEVTDSNELSKEDSEETMTDSDWLTETVTEVNYEGVMNKMEKHETTETSLTKIDEIMGRGVSKDDFEPDYLSNMGSKTSKISDQDEHLYGMSQDYDNEDPRVKRVNLDEDKSEMNPRENIGKSRKKDTSMATSLASNATLETTTIGQYIYQVSAQKTNETTMGNSEISLRTAVPAPVWEENDLKKDLSVLPQQNVDTQQIDIINQTYMGRPVTTTAANFDQDNTTGMSDFIAQNTTQVNNLNVTIYEISSHSGNQSFVSAKPTNLPTTEFVDHETEMNPFLPEVENNKSLVKKLQEGHDLEPTNLNETQNENVEEHNPNIADVPSVNSKQTTEINESNTSNTTLLITPQAEPEVTTVAIVDDDFMFNQLYTNSHEEESEFTTEINKVLTSPPTSSKDPATTELNNDKEVLPISTFLLDTDDLDTTKKPSSSTANDLNSNSFNDQMTSNPIKPNDSEFLSVVPIEKENYMEPLKKNYNSASIQELNYISDSPKKSDRRTIDVNNLDSVINDVA
ncbi:E3 ubiquitin-protein ligase lubel-like isoform X2 [Pararge aegeria]|nr:E3 ubiquitin-protein ligase lubel-like isoform X2 [Pararge aegeria]